MEKVDVEARARKARELFMSGYNCSQSVFLAYADLYGIDPKLASTIVAPLGGGMGRLREVCGAVSAAFMLTGLKYPNPSPGDKAAKTRSYAVVQGACRAISPGKRFYCLPGTFGIGKRTRFSRAVGSY